MSLSIKNTQIHLTIYQTDNGAAQLYVRIEDKTGWLTQDQMAELFDKAKSTINEHIKNIYDEGELDPEESMRKFGNSEFSTKPTNFYNLDVIISVVYRKDAKETELFFQTVQNKMHYSVTGKTAAEIISARVDSKKISAERRRFELLIALPPY